MPITYTIDRNRDLSIFILNDKVSLSEFIENLRAYIEAGPTTYEIYDVRNLSGERFSVDEINALTSFLLQSVPKRPSGGKTAVIVDRELDFGLSRMISMMTDQQVPYQIEVFRSVGDAYLWFDES